MESFGAGGCWDISIDPDEGPKAEKLPSPWLGSLNYLLALHFNQEHGCVTLDDLEPGRPRFFLPTISLGSLSEGPPWKAVFVLELDTGPDGTIGVTAVISLIPPTDSFAAGVLGGAMTSPRAIAAAFRASTSALDGRPRFFG